MADYFKNRNGYYFRLASELPDAALDRLIAMTNLPTVRRSAALSGRGGVAYATLDGAGPLVVKHYRRGGLVRFFVRSLHIGSGRKRAEEEYETLRRIRALGVNAPEPFACAYRGNYFYRAWLFTREIPDVVSLSEMAPTDPARLLPIFEEICRQVTLLIDSSVLHIDLHPGNVMVDRNGQVHLLDFDKARIFKGPRDELREQYLLRWRRSVIKHNLADELAEMFCLGLRGYFDETPA